MKRISSCWITRDSTCELVRTHLNGCDVCTIIITFWRLLANKCMFDKDETFFFSRKQFEKWILALQATTPVTRMKFRCTHDDDDSHFKSSFLVLFHLISSSRCHSSCIIADNRVVDSSSFDLCSLRMQFKMKWRSCWVHGKKSISEEEADNESERKHCVLVDRLIRYLNKKFFQLDRNRN